VTRKVDDMNQGGGVDEKGEELIYACSSLSVNMKNHLADQEEHDSLTHLLSHSH
jgi:hypothetical protein